MQPTCQPKNAPISPQSAAPPRRTCSASASPPRRFCAAPCLDQLPDSCRLRIKRLPPADGKHGCNGVLRRPMLSPWSLPCVFRDSLMNLPRPSIGLAFVTGTNSGSIAIRAEMGFRLFLVEAPLSGPPRRSSFARFPRLGDLAGAPNSRAAGALFLPPCIRPPRKPHRSLTVVPLIPKKEPTCWRFLRFAVRGFQAARPRVSQVRCNSARRIR